MSKFNSAAATGLPELSRRAIVSRLAALPLATLPTVACAHTVEADPVLRLLSQHAAAKTAASLARDIVNQLERKHPRLGRGLHAKVMIDGTVCDVGSEETLEHLLKSVDPVTRDQVWRDMEASYRRMLGGCGALLKFSTAEDRARWEDQALTARAAFHKAKEDLALLEASTGYDIAQARLDALDQAQWDLEDFILEAVPTTAAGAIALLAYVINQSEIEGWGSERYRAALGHVHGILSSSDG
jgi:hypothetical protein